MATEAYAPQLCEVCDRRQATQRNLVFGVWEWHCELCGGFEDANASLVEQLQAILEKERKEHSEVVERQSRELAEAKRDAARYGWLRNSAEHDLWVTGYAGEKRREAIYGEELDAAMDAALSR